MAVALGVKEVVNLKGGIKAWKDAGLPVEKPE
jgi:rhodanese-related sulfurtransferase